MRWKLSWGNLFDKHAMDLFLVYIYNLFILKIKIMSKFFLTAATAFFIASMVVFVSCKDKDDDYRGDDVNTGFSTLTLSGTIVTNDSKINEITKVKVGKNGEFLAEADVINGQFSLTLLTPSDEFLSTSENFPFNFCKTNAKHLILETLYTYIGDDSYHSIGKADEGYAREETYWYVTDDVMFINEIKMSSSEEELTLYNYDFNLNLKKGWNIVSFTKTITESGGIITKKYVYKTGELFEGLSWRY